MRAILVNAFKKEVVEVELSGDYRDIYRHLSDGAPYEVGLMEAPVVQGLDGHSVYVDEEGLYKPRADNGRLPAIRMQGAFQPFAGSVLVVGAPDEEGDTTPATMTVEEVRSLVRFGEMG